MRPNTALWTIASLLITVAPPLAAQEQPPVFRSGVDLITFPVRVLDSNGRPVRGLSAADFIVEFDGEPRKVTSAESVIREEASSITRTPSLDVRSYSTNLDDGARVPRTVFFVFDTGGFESLPVRLAAAEVERLLDQLPPDDLVGLTQLPIATAAVDPTDDRAKIRAALGKIGGGAPPSSTPFKISLGEAVLLDQGDSFTTGDVIERECREFFGPKGVCPQYVIRDAKLMARMLRLSIRERLRAFTAIVNALPMTADVKHVVLITPGILQESGADSLYRLLGDDLAARTATLSIIQVQGTEGSAESRLMAGKPDSRLFTLGLQNLALGTRGDLLRLGTLATRFDRFHREMDAYYVLGVSAEARDLDGERHKVSISVRRLQVTLQHPSSFVRSGTASPTTEPDRLASVMRRARTERAIPLGVQATTLRGDDPTRLQVIVLTRIPDASISKGTIAFEVRDGSRVVTAHRGELDPRNRTSEVSSHVAPMLLAPGRYVLRVAVIDAEGRAGSVDHPFEVTLPPAGALRTSGLVVGQAPGGVMRPGIDAAMGEPVGAIVELYALDRTQKADVDVSVTIAGRSDSALSRTVEARVEETESPGIRRAVASLDTTGLLPGEYVVRAHVRQKGQSTVLEQMLVLHAGGSTSDTAPASTRQTRGELPDVIARACAYVDMYLRELSNVVMDETYQQHRRLPANVGTLNTGQLTLRKMESEVLLARLPSPAGPTAFRDVLVVDNQQVRNRDDRLRRLFIEQPASAVEQARRITWESARFNLGEAVRTLNLPTVPLMFLHHDHAQTLVWTARGEQSAAGRRLVKMRFRDRGESTVLRTPAGSHVFTDGELWIDPETGAVWRADLSIRIPDASQRTNTPDLEGNINVVFDRHADWGLLLPKELTERYILRDGEENTGRAQYTNFRRFSVEIKEEVVPATHVP